MVLLQRWGGGQSDPAYYKRRSKPLFTLPELSYG